MKVLIFAIGVLLLALPGTASAADVRNGAAAVVAPGETLNDDLFATGQTVTVAGRVAGDVFALGQSVVVTGTVDGDLIAAAQQVVVDGTVNGDVRAVGATVTINGQVAHSVTSAAQQVNVGSGGRVGGGMTAAGATISVFGPVGRGITAGGGTLQLGGPVGGGVLAWAQNLSLGPNTRIAGDLKYHSEHEAQVPAGAVAGRVDYTRVEPKEKQEPILNGLLTFGSLVLLLGTAVLGAAAVTLAPRLSARLIEVGRARPLQVFFPGLIALIGVPIAIVFAGITIIGLPIAVVVGALYVAALILATPAVGLVVGAEVARLVGREQTPILGLLVFGLIVLHLIDHVPVLGPLVGFLGLAFGLGLLAQGVRPWARA